ncbi:MAG TPA: ornithine carbamoyltransferase [Actinomycetota bacterium]|nr:ornithine carbamoyltransferase [Actinomycetota bacterium]
MTRHFLSSDDLSPDEQAALVRRALDLKPARSDHPRTLQGRSVGMIFEKPSTRTRVSFEVAAVEMGAHPVLLRMDEVQLGRGESVADTARVLSRFLDAIVIRTFAQERLTELASAASVPVINALSDFEHPCQALADVMTVAERFSVPSSVRLCYLGDGNNNVCHSLLLAGAKAGWAAVTIASPEGYMPNPLVVDRAQEIAAANKSKTKIDVCSDPDEAVRGAHVLYTDVWVSMGEEGQRSERLQALRDYALTRRRLEDASPGALVMHCLPAHRGEEIEASVIDGPSSVVWDQAENRLHTAKAVLEWLMDGTAARGPR